MPPDRQSRRRIVISGMVAGVPGQGGATWAVLQWVLGLRDLGHDVLLIEPVDQLTPASVRYFDAVRDEFGLRDNSALLTPEHQTFGLSFAELTAFARTSDLLLNVSGMLRDPELRELPASRVYVDLDPAFTQLWHDVDGLDLGLDGHDHHVTVGLNIGRPECTIPTGERPWITVLPPVALEHWPVSERVGVEAWTTVANWRGYGNATHGGVRYGQKAHAWRALFDLPAHTTARLAPALAIHPDETCDLHALASSGWELLDPGAIARDPASYREFVSGSLGELGVAKEGYVVSRSGWFSDRSACYLAAGRPVVAQDTGWSAHLPVGAGLTPFATTEEAAEAIEAATRDHRFACRDARTIARDAFDARIVLPALLEEFR